MPLFTSHSLVREHCGTLHGALGELAYIGDIAPMIP